MSENLLGGNWRRIRAMFTAGLIASVSCMARDAAKNDSTTTATTPASLARRDSMSRKPALPAPPSAPAPKDATGTSLRDVATVPLRASKNLVENSAAAMSARQPGVLFSINDSGNDALLFAVDTMGVGRGAWRVLGATNVDWEATSIGQCGGAAPGSCVYIGDVGDNYGTHASRRIYRVPEPDAVPPGAKSKIGALQADALQFVYPDKPHDVEAMYVAPNGDMVLITKRPMLDAARRFRPALVFRIPASAWGARANVVAALVDSLPIVPGSVPFRLITDAALSPDAKHLAVRTYAQVFIFATDSLTGAVKHGVAPSMCDVTVLSEYQGEGVTWANNRGRLVFTSEGKRSPLHLGDCEVP